MNDTTVTPVWRCDTCPVQWSPAEVEKRQTEGFRLGSWCPVCNVGTLVEATPDEPKLNCLNGPGGCAGKVEYRMALSGTGKSFPRCDKHWSDRLEVQRGINERYPVQQPADFDPLYAGERWDEED